MTITDHAIKRYKQRIGKKTSARRKVIAEINRDLQRDVKYRKASKVRDHYILVTSRFQAVCFKSRVITIYDLKEDATQFRPSHREEVEIVA